MGDMDDDEPTAQQQYYGMLGFYERYSNLDPGYAEQAEKMRATGPPPFESRDGVIGKAVYYQHRAKQGDQEAEKLVEEIRAQHPELWVTETKPEAQS